MLLIVTVRGKFCTLIWWGEISSPAPSRVFFILLWDRRADRSFKTGHVGLMSKRFSEEADDEAGLSCKLKIPGPDIGWKGGSSIWRYLRVRKYLSNY